MATLYVVSTPIGNLEDITLRAIKILLTADIIVCEDTRRTGQLLQYYRKKYLTYFTSGRQLNRLKPKLISYYEENEAEKIPKIIGHLQSGKDVALVSNAGTPTISDPGFKLVRECVKRGIKIVPIPGSSSILAALVVSGLPTDKFFFLGYLPKKRGGKKKVLKNLLSCFKTLKQAFTIVLYESPHRLTDTLESIKETFGDIEITVARELTKIHEEIWRGKISQALAYFTKPKGEFTILFSIPQA